MKAERHPLKPFLPENAKILMLGSFPPGKEKWSMEFFYPNFINDMWRIFGLIFFEDKSRFIIPGEKAFDKGMISGFCAEKGIALYDSAVEVVRLKDNASDKFLQIVEKTDMEALLRQLPACRAIVSTGQKSASAVCEQFGCREPSMGSFTDISASVHRKLRFWRMPSTSRAYFLPVEKKADAYRKMLLYEGLL